MKTKLLPSQNPLNPRKQMILAQKLAALAVEAVADPLAVVGEVYSTPLRTRYAIMTSRHVLLSKAEERMNAKRMMIAYTRNVIMRKRFA